MPSFSQNSARQKRVADDIVGYSYLLVTDELCDLNDGVDDAGDNARIPDLATGAIIRVEMTTTGNELRIAANDTVPSIADRRGIPIYETDTTIKVGKLQDTLGDPFEIFKFKAILNTGKTAKLHVTYYKSRK